MKHQNKIIIIAVIVVLIFVVAFGVYSFLNKPISHPIESGNIVPTQNSAQENKNAVNDQALYFGKGFEGKYFLIDVTTGQTKEFLPSGYTLINQTEYQMFPTFLILQKDNNLYSYSVKDKIANSIFGSVDDLKLSKDEQVRIYPSITEKDRFIIEINKLNLSIVNEFDGSSPIISTRSYSFNALTNKLVRINTVKFDGCAKYDSKNQRFFTWPCGEGIGNSAPLAVTDLSGKEQKKVITLEEFGLDKQGIGSISLKYQNGLFFAWGGGNYQKIVVLDPQAADPAKETYMVSEQVKSQIKEAYPYSVSIDQISKTIIIGGDSYILLLRFDAQHQITQSSYIPDKDIYANFVFVNDGKLYYQAPDNIRVVNLYDWKIEKSIPSAGNFQEITLFNI